MMEGYFAQASHTCNYCSKVLPTYGELVEHKKTHVGDRPFSCHICHKRFTQKAHLNIHKRTHTGEKPYACTICHKRFAQSSHLNSHRRIHAGDRPYFCVVCNTGFSQKHRFDAHLPCTHQAKSQSSSRISAAVSSAASMAATAVAAYGGGGSGVGVSGDMEVDQKPDVRYLEALNQQALIQQLAEFSAASSASEAGANQEMRGGLEDGEIDRDSLSSGGPAQTPPREEPRGSISAACLPAMSSHRRKPAIIRHVDNEEGGNGSEINRDRAADNNGTDENSSVSTENSAAELDDGSEELRVTFQNGIGTPGERVNSGRGGTTGSLPANQAWLPTRISPANAASSAEMAGSVSLQGRTNHRISLVNFTAEELISHLMSRSDVHRCDFCRLIFQDAAMYHIHRNMHDKNDLQCCNFCGKMLQDKYDFIAHFLNEHR